MKTLRQAASALTALMMLAGPAASAAPTDVPRGTAVVYQTSGVIIPAPSRLVPTMGTTADFIATEYRFSAPKGWFTVDVRDAAVLPGGKVWIVVGDGSKSIFSGCVTVAEPHRFNVPSKTASFSVLSTSVPSIATAPPRRASRGS